MDGWMDGWMYECLFVQRQFLEEKKSVQERNKESGKFLP